MSLSKNQMIGIVAVIAVVIVVAAAVLATSGNGGGDDSKQYDGDGVTVTTFVDYNGNTADIKFDKVPERVVCGCNTALNLLLYLGLEDHIVGVYYDEEPVWDEVKDEYNKLVERIGEKDADGSKHSSKNISTDVLLSWQPDRVIGWVSWTNDGLGSESFWNENGANVMSLNTMTSNKYRNLTVMKTDYDNIGKIFDIKDKTDALYNQIVDVYNGVVQKMGNSDVTYALVDGAVNTEKGTVWAYKDSNFVASLLNGMGMKNAFPDGGQVSLAKVYEVIGTEDIDMIIYITYGSVTLEKSEASWESDPDLAKCSAIKNGHTIGMKLSASYGSSPELLDVIQQISEYVTKLTKS